MCLIVALENSFFGCTFFATSSRPLELLLQWISASNRNFSWIKSVDNVRLQVRLELSARGQFNFHIFIVRLQNRVAEMKSLQKSDHASCQKWYCDRAKYIFPHGKSAYRNLVQFFFFQLLEFLGFFFVLVIACSASGHEDFVGQRLCERMRTKIKRFLLHCTFFFWGSDFFHDNVKVSSFGNAN